MKERDQLENLYRRFLENRATALEVRELLRQIRTMDSERMVALIERAVGDELDNRPLPEEDEQRIQRIRRRLSQIDNPVQKECRSGFRKWLPYAAAVLLAATAAVWFYVGSPTTEPDVSMVDMMEVAPGTNRATLTLADGRTIELSEIQEGIITNGGIITYADGMSVADIAEGRDGSRQLSLSTPRGGTYQLTLSDGSKVRLNAASTLEYPSSFDLTGERRIHLTGEAYFEVEPDPSKPFIVVSADQEIQVLGTEFNVSAFADENETRTTLVDGSIRLTWIDKDTNPRSMLVSPKEQVVVSKDGTVKKSHVDTEQFTSWKDGYFKFDTNLEQVLRQIGRWYDIEVQFDDEALKHEEIIGLVFRDQPLGAVIEILEDAVGAQFQLIENEKGRRLVVK